jgi:hypothetical protein
MMQQAFALAASIADVDFSGYNSTNREKQSMITTKWQYPSRHLSLKT